MPPAPRRALVFHLGGVEFVLRPGSLLLFGSIAAVLDVVFLPGALPNQPALTYHGLALVMALAMIVATLIHEGGHALAYRMQGIWPVRITLRGSGGACAALVYEDTPRRALVRALAGPGATALVVGGLVGLWHLTALPAGWRLVAATLTIFSLFDLVFNTLPVHPRCDGTFALRSLLWIISGREPATFAVLYLWRPTVLAAAALGLSAAASATGLLPAGPATSLVGGFVALGLCAVPPAALAWRLVGAWSRKSALG